MKCRFLRLIVVAILPFAACAERELGVCAHLTYDEFDALEQTLAAAKAAGMRSVRTDFNFIQIKLPAEEGAAFDFARFEKVVSAAARFDIEILPVIHELPEGVTGSVRENEALWRRLVREVVSHFRGRIPAWEVWNEENIRTSSKPYEPTDYFFILRTAAEEIRAADPAAQVVLGGLSHTDTAYVEELYALGAKPYVDVLNFHCYCQPDPPEAGVYAQALAKCRAFLAKHGETGKRVWYTEMGWPTHEFAIPNHWVILAGLKLARPEKTAWRLALVDVSAERSRKNRWGAKLARVVPDGWTVVDCDPQTLPDLLARDAVDGIVYPVNEDYPIETVEAVAAFVKRGGTLVDSGGFPLYYPFAAGEKVASHDHERDRAALRIDADVAWRNRDLPDPGPTFGTPEAVAAGFKCDPTGLRSSVFFGTKYLQGNDRMLPMAVGKSQSGKEIVSAAVYLFDSDYRGRVVVCGSISRGGSNTVAEQAIYSVRGLAMLLAHGIERVYPYELRSTGTNPHFSEDHFGVLNADFTPKPAYRAIQAFARWRPDGSVNLPAPLHDATNDLYRLRWRRPDGAVCGVVWRPSGTWRLSVPPTVGECADVFGAPLAPTTDAAGARTLEVGDSPVYFREMCSETVQEKGEQR